MDAYKAKRIRQIVLLLAGFLLILIGYNWDPQAIEDAKIFLLLNFQFIFILFVVLILAIAIIVATRMQAAGYNTGWVSTAIKGVAILIIGVGILIIAFQSLAWLAYKVRDDQREAERRRRPSSQQSSLGQQQQSSVNQQKRFWNITIDPTKYWQNSGIVVNAGDKVKLSGVSGRVVWDNDPRVANNSVDYSGTPLPASSVIYKPEEFPNQWAGCGALIWKVRGQVFFLRAGESMTIKERGELETMVNDRPGKLEDNTGNFEATITVY